MNLKLNRLKTNYLLIVVGVLVAADLITRFWFWRDLHLVFDASNFNNIVTPIAAILSVFLFTYLAYKQYQLQLSSNLKQNFDREFDDLYKKLNAEIGEKVLIGVGIRPNHQVKYTLKGMNSLNYINEIIVAFERIFADPDFIKDHTDYLNNNKIKLHKSYLQNRTYYDDLRFVLAFSNFPSAKYMEVGFFLDQINDSKLVEPDKKYLRNKIEAYCLEPYFNFVMHHGGVEVPDLFERSHEVSWNKFRATGFDRHFKPFRDKLSGIHNDDLTLS